MQSNLWKITTVVITACTCIYNILHNLLWSVLINNPICSRDITHSTRYVNWLCRTGWYAYRISPTLKRALGEIPLSGGYLAHIIRGTKFWHQMTPHGNVLLRSNCWIRNAIYRQTLQWFTFCFRHQNMETAEHLPARRHHKQAVHEIKCQTRRVRSCQKLSDSPEHRANTERDTYIGSSRDSIWFASPSLVS